MRIASVAVLGVLIAAATKGADAFPITIAFTGTVTSASGIWVGEGSAVEGFFSYDSALADSLPGDPERDAFLASNPANTALPFEFSISVGSVTRTTADNWNQASLHHQLILGDGPGRDEFIFQAVRIVATDDFAEIQLWDDPPPSPPSAIRPGSGGLTDAPLLVPPDPGAFDAQDSRYEAFDNTTETALGAVDFNVDSFTLVPEPATLVLLAVGLAGFSARRPRTR